MTYVVAAVIAIPITMCGIIGVLKSRQMVKQFIEFMRERHVIAIADVSVAAVPDIDDELRFTQSLLALSRVRSPERDGFREPERAESSSLVLAHRAQSKTPDRVA